MSSRKQKAARLAPAASVNQYHTRAKNSSRPRVLQRSADNCLLDAAVCARDGDPRKARQAALRGLRALGFRVRSW